jgi:hypothetical protein
MSGRGWRATGPTAASPGDTARLYHRLSSYDVYVPADEMPPPVAHALVVQDFTPLDPARLPPTWKQYPPDLPVVELPDDWPRPAIAATEALAGHAPGTTLPLDLATLGRLLHLSAGVVRVRDARPSRTELTFRAAGSAGGRFPLEVYVVARGVRGLDDATWWYHPERHALVRVGPAAEGEATTLIVTGVPWRTAWKYAERGFRHVYWDAGSMLAQTLLVAESAGWEPRLWVAFPDTEVARIVGADGVEEWPVALVTVGPGEPSIRPAGDAARGFLGDDPEDFPLVTLAQRAGDQDTLGAPVPIAPALEGHVPHSDDVDAVVLRRGSARTLDPHGTVARETYEFTVAAALRAARTPHVLAVHAVDGVAPGLYRPALDAAPARTGDVREPLLRACWDMSLAADAAFVAIGVVDLAGVDDRGYREAQLTAGIFEGRLHLAAYALGLGASGLTFLDRELETLVAPVVAGRPGGLLVTSVGVPEYANRPGGMPRRPARIVTPIGRESPRPLPATKPPAT